MRALRYHGNNDIRIDEIPEPVIKPGHVKVRNAWCGICGSGTHQPQLGITTLLTTSDLHEIRMGPKNTRTTPHPITQETMPAIFGMSEKYVN